MKVSFFMSSTNATSNGFKTAAVFCSRSIESCSPIVSQIRGKYERIVIKVCDFSLMIILKRLKSSFGRNYSEIEN